MSLFWYPEINEKYDFEGKPDKGMLLSSYIRYYLARLQSMFVYEGLPDSIPAKWLENLLLVNGSCVWIKNGDDLIVTRAGIGGKPDVYYIPTECIVTNPYVKEGVNRTYTRDEDCVLMVNDTYAQGLLPMLKKYCAMLVENEITMNIADQLARATITISAVDDETKASAELWLKRLREGNLGIIGESPFMVGNQDKALNINQLVNVAATITDLIEYQQYIKASLYNDLGLQSNYNMKRESINSNESQLNDDMLHPLIDTMLRERQEALEKVNAMFGTNISVDFNSAWKINEEEEQLAIDQMEAAAALPEEAPEEEAPAEEGETQDIEETPEEQTEDTQDVEEAPSEEVTLSEETIEEIAEEVAEKLEGEEDQEDKEDETLK
jgi:hypothetical protein